MSFKMLFRGLICLRTEDQSAVFVGAEEHELRLIVRERDIVEAEGFDDDDAHIAQLNGRSPRKAFKIGGRVLRVDGAENGASTFGDDFMTFVPRLSQKSKCTKLRPAVANHELADHIGGYLIHPGGSYSVREFFPQKVTFTGDEKDAECVAMTTQVALATNGANIRIGDDTAWVTVKPTSVVLFVNGPNDPAMPAVNEHFGHYFHAIFEGCHGGDRPSIVDDECELSRAMSPQLPGSDCPSSGYP